MFKIVEPQWWVDLLVSLFAWMQASMFWSYWIPVLADIFVFTYPMYLIALYGYGMIQRYKRWNIDTFTRGLYHKIAAMYIFAGVGFTVVVNIFVQFFFDKIRPNIVLWLVNLKNDTLLHSFLPSSSFPSDHAAVSMGIAMMSLFRGSKHHDKKFLRFGGILIVFSLITSFARVASGVHRPTDIIGGSIVGIIVPLVLMWKPIYLFGTKIAEKIGKII